MISGNVFKFSILLKIDWTCLKICHKIENTEIFQKYFDTIVKLNVAHGGYELHFFRLVYLGRAYQFVIQITYLKLIFWVSGFCWLATAAGKYDAQGANFFLKWHLDSYKSKKKLSILHRIDTSKTLSIVMRPLICF